jgi:hypothetical protein
VLRADNLCRETERSKAQDFTCTVSEGKSIWALKHLRAELWATNMDEATRFSQRLLPSQEETSRWKLKALLTSILARRNAGCGWPFYGIATF